MTIVQFINAIEKYSMDTLALGIVVCLITATVKRIIPAKLKKYLTFFPFVCGVVVYGGYLYINSAGLENILIVSTVVKGVECGAAATIYYVLYEQFVRQKPQYKGLDDTLSLTIAGILSNIVVENRISHLSKFLATNISTYDESAVMLCNNSLIGNTKQGISEQDIFVTSRLIVNTLKILNKT